MALQDLPEVRFAELLDSIGAFVDGTSVYKRQVGYFNEDRLKSDERAICVLCMGENPNNGDSFEDSNIKIVFVSKVSDQDSVEVKAYVRKIQRTLESILTYEDFFGIINQGTGSTSFLDSGRQAFELDFRAMSNYCPLD